MGNKIEDTNTNKNYEKPLRQDPTLNGPIKNRSCTDVICCIIFIVFILGLPVVSYFAFKYGDYRLLLYPLDSESNLCGFGPMKDKPNLFFFDIAKCAQMGPSSFVIGCTTPQVCVDKCPNKTFIWTYNAVKADLICKYDTDKKKKDANKLITDNDCAPYYVNSTPFVSRCVPNFLVETIRGIGKTVAENTTFISADNKTIGRQYINLASKYLKQVLIAKQYAEKIISDIVVSWWMILIGLGFSMILSFIWIVLMRWIAGVMVWITIISFILLFAAGAAVCFWKYYVVINSNEADQVFSFGFSTFTMKFKQKDLWLGFGITAAIIFAIFLLILIFLCSRIKIAVALIKEASKAIGNMIFTLLWPFIPFILQVIIIVYWGVNALYLSSVSRAKTLRDQNSTSEEILNEILVQIQNCNKSETNSTCFTFNNLETYTIYLQVYNLFMLFWLLNFVIALGQMTLAGAFASYYWAFDKSKDIPTFPLASSFYRCFRYHLGSLAFGSLIIAIVQLIRVFLNYLDNKLKGTENPLAKFFVKCLKCCFWCLEKFLKFINKNAYIMIAVYGKNFCVSAKNAFMLIMRNLVRTVVVDKVTDFLLLVSTLVVVGAVGVSSFFVFSGKVDFVSTEIKGLQLNFYLVPVVITILGSYVIARCFFGVYEMGVDTLFLCFLDDLEKHDGSAEKPYFMSKNLMKILGKKNIAQK